MLTEIKACAESLGMSYIEGDDFDANIKADDLDYPLFICYPASFDYDNKKLLSEQGQSYDVWIYLVRVLVKGEADSTAVNHIANYKSAKLLLDEFLYRLTKYPAFLAYQKASGTTVKNFLDSYGDGLKVDLVILSRNNNDFECFIPS